MNFEDGWELMSTLKSPGIRYAQDHSEHANGRTPHINDLKTGVTSILKPISGAVEKVVDGSPPSWIGS